MFRKLQKPVFVFFAVYWGAGSIAAFVKGVQGDANAWWGISWWIWGVVMALFSILTIAGILGLKRE